MKKLNDIQFMALAKEAKTLMRLIESQLAIAEKAHQQAVKKVA